MRRLGIVLLVCAVQPALADAPPPSGPLASGIFRGRPVTYQEIGGRRVYEGDILLDHVTASPGPGRNGPQTVGVAYGQYLWPVTSGVATIPYIVTNAPSTLTTALAQFNSTFSGIIQFVPRAAQPDYVNFDFDSSNTNGTCESFVGRAGGEQAVAGAINCSLGTLLHEFGHVVGLFHEMSRSDRNTYVSFNYQNVIKGSVSNFTQLTDDFQNLTSYDYASVMSYIPYAFSRNGGPTLESIPPGIQLSNTTGYTAADIDGIKRLYGAAPTNVTITSNPPGLTVSVDGATIVTPQTYAWALNSTHTLSVPANGQTLAGAAYIYGRWSDNASATHSIKVTRGNNTVAQPSTSPAMTVYTANFVALSPYTAVTAPSGHGSVAVSPAPLTYPGLSGQYFVARQQVTLTPSANTGYAFLTWGGTDAPWSENPKTTRVPDLGAPFAVTAYLTTQPVTTITTTPPGLGFQVDGTYWYGPQNFASDFFPSWTPGSTHTLSTWTPQQPYSVNTRFNFNSWSDNGAISHSITVPAGASTLTGSFTAQYVPVVYQQPGCASTVTLSPASSDGFYTSGSAVTVKSTASTGWTLTGWLYDLKGRAAAQKLDVTDEELAVANDDTSVTSLAVNSLKPASLAAGGIGGTVAISGAGFTASSIVFVNNVYRTSRFVSSREIDVSLTAADIAQAGALPIGVSNFPPGAACSAYQAHSFFVTR
jgi:hypothetical protein